MQEGERVQRVALPQFLGFDNFFAEQDEQHWSRGERVTTEQRGNDLITL